MASNLLRKIVSRLGMAIDWRVRDVLESERQATIELGKTFVAGAAQITDQQNLLEQRVAELEKRIAELEKGTH
jgi:DNA-binding transcriptional MerR regulator